MNKYLEGLEPVRVVGWFTSTVVLAASVAKQIADNFDEGTGWLGLALAVCVAISTEIQRSKVTPVAKLTAGPNAHYSEG